MVFPTRASFPCLTHAISPTGAGQPLPLTCGWWEFTRHGALQPLFQALARGRSFLPRAKSCFSRLTCGNQVCSRIPLGIYPPWRAAGAFSAGARPKFSPAGGILLLSRQVRQKILLKGPALGSWVILPTARGRWFPSLSQPRPDILPQSQRCSRGPLRTSRALRVAECACRRGARQAEMHF